MPNGVTDRAEIARRSTANLCSIALSEGYKKDMINGAHAIMNTDTGIHIKRVSLTQDWAFSRSEWIVDCSLS